MSKYKYIVVIFNVRTGYVGGEMMYNTMVAAKDYAANRLKKLNDCGAGYFEARIVRTKNHNTEEGK